MREVLYETLNHTLSSDKGVRQVAEQKLKALEVTDEYGVCLAEIIVNKDAPLAVRQLCCVLLKQYVHLHWTKDGEKFTPPETTEQAKTAIRSLLPLGLQETLSRVRTGTAYAIAAIAHYDWPEMWPNLFDILAKSLTSGNPDLVHGAMRVLVEFSHDITDKQIEYLAPILLPECLNIFSRPEIYSIRTRSRAVELFNTLTGIINFVYEYDRSVAKRLLFPHLPKYGEAFSHALQIPDGPASDGALKAEIIKAIACLIERFPKQSKRFMPHVLPSVWTLLRDSAETYVQSEINNEKSEHEAVDSDGEVLSMDKLIFSLIEILEILIDHQAYSQNIIANLPDLIYLILIYMQIGDEKVEEWSSCIDRYVEDEDEETALSTVRAACLDLLLTLSEKWPIEASKALWLAVSRHMTEAQLKKEASPNWWKIHEVSFLALGSVAPALLDLVNTAPSEFNLNEFMSTFLVKALESKDCVFLQGQALWFASRVAACCSQAFLHSSIELCSKGLAPEQSAVMKALSAKALYNFCDFFKTNGNCQPILPFLKEIVMNLIAFGLKGGETTLNLAMSALSILIELNLPLEEDVSQKILTLSKAAMLKYSGDPVIPTYVSSIVKRMSSAPAYRSLVEQKMLPTIVSVLRNNQPNLPIRLRAVCLEVLEAEVRGSNAPLSNSLIQEAFPVAVQCVLTTDDTHTLQAGRECIRAFVSKASTQIIEWTDGMNTNGISLLVQVVCRLLDPSTPELSASMVGRLVYVLLRKADQSIAPYLEQILRSVLCKMQYSELPAVHQSLIMVFAHLIHYHLEAVLKFLSSVPAPDGNSALQFVFTLWCDRQKMFFGAYDQKISTLALCKVLLHALTSRDKLLSSITVLDDQQPITSENDQGGYSLRSRSTGKVENRIPLLVRIYKLIIHELNSLIEEPEADQSALADENDSESDGEDTSTKKGDSKDYLPEVLASLTNDLEEEESDGDDEDPDIEDDPRAQLNLKNELINFLHQLSHQPYYEEFCQFATPFEFDVLKKAQIIVT